MLFKEIIAFYSKNHVKPLNTKKEESLTVEAGGIYSYHHAQKGSYVLVTHVLLGAPLMEKEHVPVLHTNMLHRPTWRQKSLMLLPLQ
jgi:hypothetical protein